MKLYRTHIVNRDFRESNLGEHLDQETAIRAAIRGALQIGMDEICNGEAFFGADITVALDGEIVERRIVAIGATPLQMPSTAELPERGTDVR